MITIRENIMAFLKANPQKSYSIRELSQQLDCESSQAFKELVKEIAFLEEKKDIKLTSKGKVTLPHRDTLLLEGHFHANERGFGFVTLDESEPDIFIPKEKTNYALDGDTVLIDIVSPGDYLKDRMAEGKVVEIKKRHMTQIVGEFIPYDEEEIAETDLYGFVKPQDKKLANYRVYVAKEGLQPVEGSICVVSITHYPEKGYDRALEGVILQTVGHKNDPGMDILTIVMQHGIPTTFPDEVMEEVAAIPDEVLDSEREGRRDLRDRTIVTIDGAEAKDLDDAISFEKTERGTYRLGVHIADVAHYVRENTALNAEAYKRATSVYLTDRVIPMLPHRLSNGICSLNPNVDRLTLSCEMEIDSNGKVMDYEIYESVIRTKERMTYDAVNEILSDEHSQASQDYAELGSFFKEMSELHFILEKMRERRGAISFESKESYIQLDETGKPLSIVLRERGVAEKMIESFMLMANETIAAHYEQEGLPFIYRIHEEPKTEKIQRFFEFLTNFDVVVKGTKDNIDPKELQKVMEHVEEMPEKPIINMMLLRSMQQAKYAAEPLGHYGLATDDYTHFTSPIRRYPDLIVHRLIKKYMHEPITPKMTNHLESTLPDIALHSSIMERRSVDAERDTDSLKKTEFMADKVGQEFEGVISSITKFGIFVELPNTVEGLIHVSQLKDDYYHFIENHLTLVGERTRRMYKIGQQVTVKLMKADVETREIDFELLNAEQLADDPRIQTNIKRKNHEKRERNSGKRKRQTSHKSKHKAPFYKKVAKKKKKKK
ncbi:ribonuclease R [Vagococcus lutrae]|uniref:ribonuclease R n=1 Tax=Vagococcus lutrae TaxID=81947 RepID=UPI00289216BE|nr:ribonuclease R [Vagococcus lutrae]MDT2802446.1 ribonuclease R [Vagococcus lutrae]MDT2826785.1 ribonuclease R [Vagococcus lutrae]MDT2842669.1 ribonuclease R [Vagococcus lutrae]